MARLPRYFVEGMPQHIIQRGNNRDVVYAADEDYRFYMECLGIKGSWNKGVME